MINSKFTVDVLVVIVLYIEQALLVLELLRQRNVLAHPHRPVLGDIQMSTYHLIDNPT